LNQTKAACVRAGFEPIIVYESAQWDFIYEWIGAGQGIALLPDSVCEKFDPRLVSVIPEITPSLHWDLGIIWKNTHPPRVFLVS